MSVIYVTHPNGFTEIIGERTLSEEAEWFSRHNKVSKFLSANYRSPVKSPSQSLPKPQKET